MELAEFRFREYFSPLTGVVDAFFLIQDPANGVQANTDIIPWTDFLFPPMKRGTKRTYDEYLRDHGYYCVDETPSIFDDEEMVTLEVSGSGPVTHWPAQLTSSGPSQGLSSPMNL